MIKTSTNVLQIVNIMYKSHCRSVLALGNTPSLPSLPPSPHTNQFLYVEILTTSLILLF
jgi:hypothetical protein